jgi:transposase-like protein
MSNELGKLPASLQEAVVYFSDLDQAHKFATMLRWPNGIECPRCGSKEHSFISTRRMWFCKGCKKQFTVKVASIFEDSPLGMDKWMLAVWLIVTCKNGISSYEIASHLKITQKSAWHLMHRVRKAMRSGSFTKLSGEIEVDESFIGGKARNMHADKRARRITGTGGKDKVAVIGILERGGKIRTSVVPNRKKKALQSEVRKHVEAGSALQRRASFLRRVGIRLRASGD